MGGERKIAVEVRLDRKLERLLGERGHGKELVLKGYELLLKMNTGHGGSPFGILVALEST
jgi:hypothetical protein